MPATVLFDLDDTLLKTNMNRFLPGYFGLLGKALSHLASLEKITQQIQFAVRKMDANTDPSKTLKEVFDRHFYEPLGTTEKACRNILNTFYKDQFPQLQSITQTKPEASELVAWCQSKSMTIAIATNPLFPRTATQQRIQWAGLDPKDFSFFTTYEDFHFTKPNLSYYAEVLARLGWPDGAVVMIGDSLELDLVPMKQMGFETFWITSDPQTPHQPGGTLGMVQPWLSNLDQINNTLKDHREVNLAILQSTPAVIDSWLRLTQSKQFPILPKEAEKLFFQSLQGMIDHEKVTIKKLNKIFLENSSGLPSNFVKPYKNSQQQLVKQTLPSLLNSFIHTRINCLTMLNKLLDNQAHQDTNNPGLMTSKESGTLISAAAKHDRVSLQACVKILNIYKIY